MNNLSEAEVDQATDKFLADHAEAVTDLVRKVGDEALAKLHCLKLWGSPVVHQRLRDLIRKVVRSKVGQGGYGTGTWESDDLFVVTMDDLSEPGMPGQQRIRVAVCLAESRVQ